ncbi:epoxyqueuosine reductase [Anaerovirgula multivorans]|uniref:Epoxyqueuosine reductase n=1 Tax=Anaerovirgula multivorans TaxID=312168 RepID=A0A239H7P4_9FIRM|nr:tRNA epoxyqueuosine(34) reductase QueG [Anaerovirgula multivorans]SNS76274.1 epoxyqueuosine reductase [Anaerovirgula multivorans]
MTLKEQIVNYAKSIGVSMIGFTSAEAFEDIRGILEERKKLEYLSGFEEKDIDLRIDPKKTMPEAKSILVIALPYYIDEENLQQKETPLFHGELARTAWGKDYHDVVKEKLEKIATFIKGKKEKFDYKSFVDTGPLVDRHVAYRAGLGWYGYNSILMNDEYGSWFFIGYMLNNLEIPSDKPLNNRSCQGCNLCIKHCPKGAIEAPYKFNAKKCLSNILQQKEDIKESDRKSLGKSLYGCDICQQVCPHNKEIKKETEEDFYPKEALHKPDLLQLLSMSNKEFKKTYGETSAGWRGKKILQRNAIIALVNHGDKKTIPYLLPLLQDNRPEIRKYAIWAICELDPFKAYQILMKVKKQEKDEEVLKTIEYYCKKISCEKKR